MMSSSRALSMNSLNVCAPQIRLAPCEGRSVVDVVRNRGRFDHPPRPETVVEARVKPEICDLLPAHHVDRLAVTERLVEENVAHRPPPRPHTERGADAVLGVRFVEDA